MNHKNHNKLNYISLFSGAGIGCFGFKQNKFDCIATNEYIEKRLEIQRFNQKCKYESGYISGDITKPHIKQKIFNEIEFWNKKHNVKEIDVVIATPPCQGMSVANHKKKNELKRNSLVVESILITEKILPKIFIFENVRSFLKTICTDSDNVNKPIDQAIYTHLNNNYNILSKVINLKNYGSNSSRTRTIVIGVRKDLKNISPYDFFPSEKTPKNLKQVIGDLKSLKLMGEIDKHDIYHSYRSFDKRMLPWIENLKEGESAFNNKSKKRIPHRIINGEIIFNKSSNGDKYRRCSWNQVGPCIHTRNDILASQSTIHPSDNRVFSIRELMKMMTIPTTFKWHKNSLKKLNSLDQSKKIDLMIKSDNNIRQCLGEAVPTAVFHDIALKIKFFLQKRHSLGISDLNKLISINKLYRTSSMIHFIKRNKDNYSINELFNICEISNSKRLDNAAYFTSSDIVFSIIKDLPDFKNNKKLKILEPSVGVGNFIPQIIQKYKNCKEVQIDVIDIDSKSLKIFKTLIEIINPPSNIKINVINEDFLKYKLTEKYDLVIGNPPFKKITGQKDLLESYREISINKKTNNIFSFFIDKSINISKYVALITPKSLTHSPEFDDSRDMLNELDIIKICDYGEKAFKGVKIETISMIINVSKKKSDKIIIESFIKNETFIKRKKYIFSKKFPYWILYRDKKFDKTLSKMTNNVFDFFRDRQITKKITRTNGNIRVLKSRNLGNNEIIDIKGFDCFVNDMDGLAVSKHINKNAVMVPNLSYYPRACFLPKNTITDGSIALLFIRDGYRKPKINDLNFYGTKEFEYYYKVARNFGTRSLNIDKNSIFFFGLLKD